MTVLVSGVVDALLPILATLLTDPHASPPLRLLLLVLTPNRLLPTLDGSGGNTIRSKRSTKYRKGQEVQGKSIFGDEGGKGKGKLVERDLPSELLHKRKEIRRSAMEKVGGTEWRSMGVDPVGSIAVQVSASTKCEIAVLKGLAVSGVRGGRWGRRASRFHHGPPHRGSRCPPRYAWLFILLLEAN